MKLLNKAVLTLVFLSLSSLGALAHPSIIGANPHGTGSGARVEFTARVMTDMLSDTLKLTPLQIEQVYILNYEFGQKQSKIQRDLRAKSLQELRTISEEIQIEMEELGHDKNFAMSLILDTNQQQIFAKIQQEIMENVKIHRPSRPNAYSL